MMKLAMLSAPRPLRVWSPALLASAALLLWTAGVFVYGGHEWIILRTGVWVAPWTWRIQVDQTLLAWREQLTVVGGLLLMSAVPRFRLALAGGAGRRGTVLTMAALGAVYALYAWDAWGLMRAWQASAPEPQLGSEPGSYGVLIVAVAGLLGGWRWGLAFGALNLGVAGSLFVRADVFGNLGAEPWLRSLLAQTWAVAGLWVGVVGGVLGSELRRSLRVAGQTRSPSRVERWPAWMVVPGALLVGTGLELVVGAVTLATTYAPPYHFDRLTHNLRATGPGLALLVWVWRAAVLNDPRRLQQAQSQLTRVQAELRALRAQMQPHFLLNALSVIHHLTRSDPERARTLMLDLSDVLRHTLHAGDFVPLRLELEQTRAYLALEQARYTERLRVVWRVETGRQEQAVPLLTLQPLVENAVRHGLAPRPEGGTVWIMIRDDARHLHLCVEDDGVGLDAPPAFPELAFPESTLPEQDRAHIGLSNIDERLRLLYGPGYGVTLARRPGGGTRVELRLPLQPDPGALSSPARGGRPDPDLDAPTDLRPS